MRNKLNKIIGYIVIICFIYLIILKNALNVKTVEVIYFKSVMLIIISLIIMLINQIINKYAINIDLPLKSYIKIHPIRSVILFVILLITILICSMFLLGVTNILWYIIPLILICFSGIIGFYIGMIEKD